MSVDPFDLICGSCEYRHIEYNSKAEDYGLGGFSNSCERREYGIERCPKAADWRRYFQENKEPRTRQGGNRRKSKAGGPGDD